MKRTVAVFVALLVSIAVAGAGVVRQENQSIWTVDFMRTKPGQQARYLRYLDANWARARRTVQAQGGVKSFRVLVSPDSLAPWDVVLLTEYPDSAALARAEEVFRPVLTAQGETLIDGMSGRGPDNALKQSVVSHQLRSPIVGPR